MFPPKSTREWVTLARMLQAIPPTAEDLVTYRRLTGREGWPTDPIREAYFIIGRRGGDALVLRAAAAFERVHPWPFPEL